MKVVFRTNLGSDDARKLGLDHTKCLQGKSVEVSKEAGEVLIDKGIAETPEKAEDDPVVQSAVEESEKKEAALKAVAKEPGIKAPAK